MTSKTTIRKELRSQRRALTDWERESLAYKLFTHFHKERIFRNSRNIAVYLSNDGEIDLWPLIQKAWRLKKNVFLPVLHRPGFDHMMFAKFDYRTRLVDNRFGIAEPRYPGNKIIRLNALDLVLMPLVAFDDQGNRLGMGGGFYDRTFAYLNTRTKWNKPKLIGTAYDFQQVKQLPSEPWDVPLDGVVTPSVLHHMN